MSKTKRTPGPWRYHDRFIVGSDRTYVCEVSGSVANDTHMEDAAHIVSCVNAHDDLVAALKTIAEAKRKDGLYDKHDAAGFIVIATEVLKKCGEIE